MNDDLTLVLSSAAGGGGVVNVSGRKIRGWKEIRITRGMERCPSDFEVAITELYPDDAKALVIQPGDSFRALLGEDLIMTGYIDRLTISSESYRHSLTVSGRSKCSDLVDCGAEWPGGQISGSSALEIATKLAQPYGISVIGDVDTGQPIPQFNLNYGETPFEVIERIGRYRGLLAYDNVDGNLVLARVGSRRAASGFTQGQNVQRASVRYAQDQRFSEYAVTLLTTQTLSDIGNIEAFDGKAVDDGIRRHRRRYVVVESAYGGLDVAQLRAAWEANRRIGRGAMLSVTTDSWRDAAGELWEPNTLVPLDLPILKIPASSLWPADRYGCISEVTYVRDNSGTRAELLIMPPAAFDIQPIRNPNPLPEVAPGIVQAPQ